MTRESISRWETGKRVPGPWWLRHLATVLQVPFEILERAGVDRRRFITEAVGVSIAPLVASDLIEHGFAAALDGGYPSVDDWGQVVDTYGRDYMTFGAGEIQKRLAADLVVLQQQLDTPCLWAYEGASLPAAELLAEQAIALDERPSLGRLGAVMGKAHVAALRGDSRTAMVLLDEGRRVFDAAGSDEAESDYAVPWWRFNVFISLMAARLGVEHVALRAQDEAARALPESLPRFRTHLELHRGLMLARAGDREGGTAYARAALDALPVNKHSLTLRMLMTEIEGS